MEDPVLIIYDNVHRDLKKVQEEYLKLKETLAKQKEENLILTKQIDKLNAEIRLIQTNTNTQKENLEDYKKFMTQEELILQKVKQELQSLKQSYPS